MTADEALGLETVRECISRGFISVHGTTITYNLNQRKSYSWSNPEEWVRCATIAFLIFRKQYPAQRIRTEVQVPRRTPSDKADIVVYKDDRCRHEYLVVENKAAGRSASERAQGIEQMFGNANSLRAPLGLYDEGDASATFDVANYPQSERSANRLGDREAIPEQYGDVPLYTLIAGTPQDIEAAAPSLIEARIKRAHSLIWAGGKRDPLQAFDEWSKLLFAKVVDERQTPTGQPRSFQIGTNETTAAVANRIHRRFEQACRQDPTIFPPDSRIRLPDRKVYEVVETLQRVSFVRTDVDSIGMAFESFFGSVFRGELGQYFTMRPLARFAVAMSGITDQDYCLDPTAGSGGFLLEALLQVWHNIDEHYRGQPASEIDRTKIDFALHKVYGIEIHEVLARICKINLLLHHDGHTNIEGNRSALDSVFARPRLNPPSEQFTKIFGNPPFGDEVKDGDEDHLGENTLEQFSVAEGRSQVASEHIILERCIQLLARTSGSRLALVLPDGLFNNQGEISNCPRIRRLMMSSGEIEAIVSLPDYAFRKSGAQNKTSILILRRFTHAEQIKFDRARSLAKRRGCTEDEAIAHALRAMPYYTFMAEAHYVGYTTTGAPSDRNDLYRGQPGGRLDGDQEGTILGEFKRFQQSPRSYQGSHAPDCMALLAADVWAAHPSRRLDPKYHLFKREEREITRPGWVRRPLREVMTRRETEVHPEVTPDAEVRVMTVGQNGEIRAREAGKGRNPPEWLGMYFADSPSSWYSANSGDLVFSSIDLWKGCVAIVPQEMDGALVTREFPIYEISDESLDPDFLSTLLRSRYYQRAFRAITTGHSNRRRTQVEDFEELEIIYPSSLDEQRELVRRIVDARSAQREKGEELQRELRAFSDLIDGRGDEEALDELDAYGEDATDE